MLNKPAYFAGKKGESMLYRGGVRNGVKRVLGNRQAPEVDAIHPNTSDFIENARELWKIMPNTMMEVTKGLPPRERREKKVV